MRPNTASIAEMVSAAVFPVSRAASVTRADRAKTPRRMMRCRNFAAYERAEQKKSRKLAFRAAVQSGTSSFRTVCLANARGAGAA